MKKFLVPLFVSLVMFCGCLTSEYNVRVLYDTDREYESADSTQYNMKWHDQRWLSKNLKYWSSSGVIVTNWYNVFHGNDWLKRTIDNGFEGTIAIQHNFSEIIPYAATMELNSFAKEYYNIQTAYFSNWLKTMGGSFVSIQSSEIIGNTYPYISFVMNPTIFNTEAYRNSIVELYVEHILELKNDLGIDSNDKINFAIMFDEYEYETWGWGDEFLMFPTEIITDPASLGKTYGDYTSEEKRIWMSEIQSNIIDAFYSVQIPVIVKGSRLTEELLLNSDLVNEKIMGFMFDDVNLNNINEVESQVSTIRSYDNSLSTEESLLLIAGVKADVYNMKPTLYANLIKRITNAGMYFTSGSDGTGYWNAPLTMPGDWWVRNNRDSNWQAQVPTYANNNVHPRKLMIPMSEEFGISYSNDWGCVEPEEIGTYIFPTNNAATDSGSIDFEFIYNEDTDLFHIIQIPGGHLNWQGFITPPKNASWFQHFTSEDLETWAHEPNINLYDATYAKTNVWAPSIIKYDDTWYMYYTAVDASVSAARAVQRIMVCTSQDLYTWSSGSVVLEGDDLASGLPQITLWDSTPNADWDGTGACRDAIVIRNETNDGWLMFASVIGNTAVVGHTGLVICIASSSSPSGPFEIIDYVRETTDWHYGPFNGESPNIWVEDGTYYLQWATNDATDPWIDGAALKTTTPSDGYIAGNTWGSPAFSFPYKATEMLKLNNGDRIMAYLKLHPTLGGSDYYCIGFRRYIANPSGTDEFYNQYLPSCYDGNPFFTELSVPSPPEGFGGVALSSTSIKLYWTSADYGDVFGYNIYRGTTSGSEILIDTTTNKKLYIDDGLTTSQTYYYKIATVNHNGNISELSSEISITP